MHRSWLKGAASGAVFAGAVSAIYAFGAHRRLAGVLLPLLIFAEVWNGNGDQLPLVAREALELPSPFASAVRAGSPDVPPPRVVPVARPLVSSTVTLGDGPRWVATMRELLRTDVAALEGIASFGSDLPGTTVRDFLLLGVREERASFFGGRLGACHRVVDPAEPLRRGQTTLARTPHFEGQSTEVCPSMLHPQRHRDTQRHGDDRPGPAHAHAHHPRAGTVAHGRTR